MFEFSHPFFYYKKPLSVRIAVFVVGEDGFVRISARRAEIEVRLGLALAGSAHPRCI